MSENAVLLLLVAMLLFAGTHIGLTTSTPKTALVARLGPDGFRGVYSAVAAITLLGTILAWNQAPWIPVWEPGPGLRHLTFLLMPVAFILLVAALTGSNPSAIGQSPAEQEPARGIIRVTRHPMNWGIALWGIAHVLANGDLAALVFFGGFTLLAIVGTIHQDRRMAARPEPRWRALLEVTSHVPFAAILARRQRFVASEIGWWRPALGLVLFAAVLWLHPLLFGMPALG